MATKTKTGATPKSTDEKKAVPARNNKRKQTGASLTAASAEQSSEEEVVLVNLSQIRRDGGTQMRPELSKDHVETVREGLRSNAPIPAIKLVFDGTEYWLWDGYHRYQGYEEEGRKAIPSHIRPGTRRDAVWLAASANKEHLGLPRSQGTKRRAVRAILSDPEWREDIRTGKISQRGLAAHIGCDEKLVRIELKALEEEEAQQKMTAEYSAVDSEPESPEPPSAKPSSVTGKDGRTYNMTNLRQRAGSSRSGGGSGATATSQPATTPAESPNGRSAAPVATPAPVILPPKPKPILELVPKPGEVQVLDRHAVYCGATLSDPEQKKHFPSTGVDLCFSTLLFNDTNPAEYRWKCNAQLLDYAKVVVMLVQQADAILDVARAYGIKSYQYAIESILSGGNESKRQWGWVGFFSKEERNDEQDFTQSAFASPNQLLKAIIENYVPKREGKVLVLDGPSMIGFSPIVAVEETGRRCFLVEPNASQLAEQITDYKAGYS